MFHPRQSFLLVRKIDQARLSCGDFRILKNGRGDIRCQNVPFSANPFCRLYRLLTGALSLCPGGGFEFQWVKCDMSAHNVLLQSNGDAVCIAF